MMEIFKETDKKWGNGILLNEYEGRIQLIRAAKSRKSEGTVYMKWGFPQNGKTREPTDKAIPWGVDLGNGREAVEVLKFFLAQLQGDEAIPTDDKDDIPF